MKWNQPFDADFGPAGSLYVIDFGLGSGTGRGGTNEGAGIYRIDHVGDNRLPDAKAVATPDSGPAPLPVKFSSAASGVPGGQPVTYAWDFDGDGTTDSAQPNPSHVYRTEGRFTARLTVTGPGGLTGSAVRDITVGNTRPVVTVQQPPDGGMFSLGDTIPSTVKVKDREDGKTGVSTLRAQRARAILLIGSGFEDRAWERNLDAELTPYILAGGRVAVVSRHRSLRADAVLPENRAGAAALARALLALGHREFGVLRGPSALTTVADRLTGFRETLAEAGIALRPESVVRGAFTRDGGYAAALELLAGRHRPTCVFAVTDVIAVGALAAFREAGLRVPEDVSLAGFDDIPLVGELTPPLTTVALSLTEMGQSVISLALREPRGARSRVLRVDGEVVLRDSTAPPRAGHVS